MAERAHVHRTPRIEIVSMDEIVTITASARGKHHRQTRANRITNCRVPRVGYFIIVENEKKKKKWFTNPASIKYFYRSANLTVVCVMRMRLSLQWGCVMRLWLLRVQYRLDSQRTFASSLRFFVIFFFHLQFDFIRSAHHHSSTFHFKQIISSWYIFVISPCICNYKYQQLPAAVAVAYEETIKIEAKKNKIYVAVVNLC